MKTTIILLLMAMLSPGSAMVNANETEHAVSHWGTAVKLECGNQGYWFCNTVDDEKKKAGTVPVQNRMFNTSALYLKTPSHDQRGVPKRSLQLMAQFELERPKETWQTHPRRIETPPKVERSKGDAEGEHMEMERGLPDDQLPHGREPVEIRGGFHGDMPPSGPEQVLQGSLLGHQQYHFVVEPVAAGKKPVMFTECAGLGLEYDTDINKPGGLKSLNVTFRRPITGDLKVWEWRKKTYGWPTDVIVRLFDHSAQEVARWELKAAWPKQIQYTVGNGVVFEEVVLVSKETTRVKLGLP